MIELERTYLLKYFPDGFENAPKKEIVDLYIPASSPHPNMRIRVSDNKPRLTKKVPITEGDSSHQMETTIALSQEEYAALCVLPNKEVRKMRHYLEGDGVTYEIDVFAGALKGLALVDVEFESVEAKDAFSMPDFCLCDVTQETFIAGGMLAGKSYADIAENLSRFGYQPAGI